MLNRTIENIIFPGLWPQLTQRHSEGSEDVGEDVNRHAMTRVLGIMSTCISAPRADASVCFLPPENVLLGFGKVLTRKPRILEICLFCYMLSMYQYL